MKRGSILLLPILVLCFVSFLFAQGSGTIANRITADPGGTGYARWIRIEVRGGPGGTDNLDDNFTGVTFLVDLNLDFDDDETTHLEDVYEVRGNDGDIKSSPSGTKDYDKFFYLPIRGDSTELWDGVGYPTHIVPRVKLVNAGSLRVGTSPFQFSIGIDTDFGLCMDSIAPMIRVVYFYDDGSGNTNPVGGTHPGNKVAFDGYIDRLDLIWSEPMRTSNTKVYTTAGNMFSGLGSSIYAYEQFGVWMSVDTVKSRFTFYVVSKQPNTGLGGALTYNPDSPAQNVADRFREAAMPAYPTKVLNYAQTQTRGLTDKAGPAIVSANTERATRRQSLANTLSSRQIKVTFSEPVLLSSVVGGDFVVITSATSPGQNPISLIISPQAPITSSDVYQFKLTTNFASGDETGTIQFVNYNLVSDVLSNWNGISTANVPPTLPASSSGAVVPITDGIFPIIISIVTVDANPATELNSGGSWGWGYLDYVDVIYDHTMNTGRKNTSGFAVTGTGIYSIGNTGSWIGTDTLRIPLVATSPKVANTGDVPIVSYNNPGDAAGQEASNGGNAENLLATDWITSSTNALAYTRVDGAGPAIIYSITAGYKRIRISFSEKVNTSGWPASLPGAQIPSRFRWYVGNRISDPTSILVYFTGLSAGHQDSVIFLNQTGLSWAKTDSGGINFYTPGVVLDIHSIANSQWDNDNTLLSRSLTGSDVRIHNDNIPPELTSLETRDFDRNGKLDHYRFTFTDLSPIFPRKSFYSAYWEMVGYDDANKINLSVDLNVYNMSHPYFQLGAINAWGDTVEVYIRFNETAGTGPAETPYGGDTGDIPDVIVGTNHGFADWANNYMAALPPGLTIEKDKVGPAIMRARTISTTEVEALLSEKVKSTTLDVYDFNLDLGINYNLGWPISLVQQPSAGKVRITVVPFLSWLPTQTAMLNFTGMGVVTDDIPGDDNGNQQVFPPIEVIDNAASTFEITQAIPGDIIVDIPFQIKVRALDSHGGVDTNFPELVHLSANLTQEDIDVPEGAQRLVNGYRYFTAVCHVATDSLQITISVDNDRYSRFHSTSDYMRVIAGEIDGPDTLIVEDMVGDQGGWVLLTFDYSLDHPGLCQYRCISYYQIWREINGKEMFWGEIPATLITDADPDSMHYPVVTNDNLESRFWVRAVYDPKRAPGAMIGDPKVQHALIPYNNAMEKSKSRVEGTLVKIVSGAATATGRAVDNIAPQSPANVTASKEGVSVRMNWTPVAKGVDNSAELYGIKYEIYSHSSNAYFDPDVEGSLLATVSEPSYLLSVDQMRLYLCVRAIDSDNKSAISARVGKYGFAFSKGDVSTYNHISTPLQSTVLKKAKDLATDIGNGVEVLWKLSSATNAYSIYYLPSIAFGTNFELKPGTALIAQVSNDVASSWFYAGAVPAAGSVQYTINKSSAKVIYNEITLPLDKVNIKTADQLAKDMGGVEVLWKLDPATNSFSTYWLPSVKYGNNFAIEPGEPVLIGVNNSAPDIWPNYAPASVYINVTQTNE